MKFQLKFTEAGLTVSSEGIPLFRLSRHSMTRSFGYLQRTFRDGQTVDSEVFLTVIKVLRATWRAPDFLVNLVMKPYLKEENQNE